MKKMVAQTMLVAMLLLGAIAVGFAAGPVTLKTNTLWSGKVTLNGAVIVPENIVLTIAAGTEVAVSGYWDAKLVVYGTLRAIGRNDLPIRFTIGENAGYWTGIAFIGPKAGGAIVECQLRNAASIVCCMGASPKICRNTLVKVPYGGSGASIWCIDGASPLIEGNTISQEGRPFYASAICVEAAAPAIRNNTFRGYLAGVQVTPRTNQYLQPMGFAVEFEKIVGLTARAQKEVPVSVAPLCQGNECIDGVELFDPRQPAAQDWRAVYTSPKRPILYTRLSKIEKNGSRERFHMVMRAEEIAVSRRQATQLILEYTDGAYRVREKKIRAADAGIYPPAPPRSACQIDGATCEVAAIDATLADGSCNDTHSAYVLLLRQRALAGADHTLRRELLWASPHGATGNILAAMADLDGDGNPEIIAVTCRGCVSQGQIIVYHRAAITIGKNSSQN